MARTPKIASAVLDRDDSGGGNSSNSERPWYEKTHRNSPDITSYALPQWLVPEKYKDKQSSQNATQTRVFSIPLLEVDATTKEAVRAYLVKHCLQQKSSMKDSERKLKELKFEEKHAATKAKAAKDKLAQALFARSEKLKEIRKAHEAKTNKAMEELEGKIREEQQKEDLQIEQKIKEECRLEYEKKFEEEMDLKRKREKEEDENEEAAASAAKKAREDAKGKSAEGKSNSTGDDADTDNKTDLSTVETLEIKQEDLKEKMEKLSEKKSELFWLLKQVIKQESLQKIKMKTVESK